jgi:hypothetical protein
MTKVIVRSPFEEFELSYQHWHEPQCRMPGYAASDAGTLNITVFGADLFGMIRHANPPHARFWTTSAI